MPERAIDPITVRLSDGRTVGCLLSMGGIRRLKKKFGVSQIADILGTDISECGPAILHEAIVEPADKYGLTEDQLADLLPSHLDATMRIVVSLLGASFPDRPTEASAPPLVS